MDADRRRPGLILFSQHGTCRSLHLYFFVTALTAFFALLVVVAVVILAIKHRDPSRERVGVPISGSIPLELCWSIVPFFISMAIFWWATVVLVRLVQAPD